jgi:hypothetical protein
VECRIESAQVYLIDEVVQGVFEGAGDELPVEAEGKE